MSRHFFKRLTTRFAPLTERITGNPWVRRRLPALADPDLWHLNRRSTARGVAIGLVCGLIPGPLQSVAAGFACLGFRGNFPLAVLTTFYTNPFTIVPLYVVAYQLGQWTMPASRHAPMALPPPMSFDFDGLTSLVHWAATLGPSLAIGLPLLAALLGLLGFATVHLMWRYHTARAWQRRAQRRARA